MYIYNSPIGTFTIRALNGRFALLFDHDALGFYESPIAAADDVYTHTTGLDEWDSLDCQIDNVPTDIFEWQKI